MIEYSIKIKGYELEIHFHCLFTKGEKETLKEL